MRMRFIERAWSQMWEVNLSSKPARCARRKEACRESRDYFTQLLS
jgi:hypothetical protein